MKWEQVVEVPTVSITVHRVSPEELTVLQRKYAGDRGSLRELDNGHREGLAVLFTNRTTGARRCEIYVSNEIALTKKLADTLAHEAAHCLGFTHE